METDWDKHEKEEETKLIKKVAKFYANNMYSLKDEVTDEEIMKVSEIIANDPKKEEYFNNLITVIKTLKEK